MKLFLDLLLQIFCCAMLPFSVCVYLLFCITVCLFGEHDFLGFAINFLFGFLTPWTYYALGYLGQKCKAMTKAFRIKMMVAYSVICLVLMGILTFIILVTPIPWGRLGLLILFTAGCLLPRILLHAVFFVKKKGNPLRVLQQRLSRK